MKIKNSISRLCVCNDENSNKVYIDTIELKDHELESLNGLYCIDCNSFWREP